MKLKQTRLTFDEFYNKSNKTERYLFDISILANYNSTLLNEFNKFKYKRVFLGKYYDRYSRNNTTGFFVVIDTTRNNNIDTSIKVLMKLLERHKSLHISTIQNTSSITIILKLGLSETFSLYCTFNKKQTIKQIAYTLRLL